MPQPRTTITLLLGALLVGTALLAGVVWNAWPAATARQFVLACGRSSVPDADLPLRASSPEDHAFQARLAAWQDTGNLGLGSFREMVQHNPGAVVFNPHPRTLADRCAGRLTVTVAGERGRYRIWIERGKNVSAPAPVYMYGGHEFTLDVF
jgi:hypothetical protein